MEGFWRFWGKRELLFMASLDDLKIIEGVRAVFG
jgi:hypothetical protein